MSALVTYTGAMIADILSTIGAPGGSTVQSALDAYRDRQSANARAAILVELRGDTKAVWQVANEDALFGAIHRLQRAAIEGAGRHNLRLLAKAIAGTLMAGDMTADRFNVFADTLATLSRTECWLLGTLHATCTKHRNGNAGNIDDSNGTQFWDEVKSRCIPKLYEDDLRLQTSLASLQRTGLVIPVDIFFWIKHGCYQTSPLMDRLAEIIDAAEFEAAAATL